MSTTPFAILGLLSIEPMSGYDIRRNLDESLSYFWSESYGQIYPSLKKLEASRLIAPVRRVPAETAAAAH
jgi:PadR family transcriptional regulator AphA